MIYVNQKQLEQVEYLIEQSAKGFHILFDNDVIRRAFSHSPSKEGDSIIEKHIENIILQPSLIAKRAYLEKLKPQTFAKVVRTYFSIVENNVFESSKYNQ